MPRTRIKFCGITRPQDAVAATAAGADAIGLIFYEKSSRYVCIDQAREILRSLPPMVSPVALFVNASVDQIIQTVTALNIRTIQLHGNEPPETLSALSGFTVIKALQCSPAILVRDLQIWRNASALLLETAGTGYAGGSGIENDWLTLDSILKTQTNLPPLIAAGGLTPENVGSVVRLLRPYAVDVSSGIEQSKGIKSPEKMQSFIAAVQSA